MLGDAAARQAGRGGPCWAYKKVGLRNVGRWGLRQASRVLASMCWGVADGTATDAGACRVRVLAGTVGNNNEGGRYLMVTDKPGTVGAGGVRVSQHA